MPPKNSTQKVAKAARTSGKRGGPVQRRSFGFPLACVLILAVGLVVIGFGRDRRVGAVGVPPVLGKDHWHSAYGIWICDGFRPGLTDLNGDANGVHTHLKSDGTPDGIMHIHPSSSLAAGKNADIADFWLEVGLEVEDDKITFPGGAESFSNGDTCEGDGAAAGQPGQVVLLKWDNVRDEESKPRFITENLAGTRFENDGEGYVIAFVPESLRDTIPKPPSVSEFDSLVDVDPSTFEPNGQPITATSDGSATSDATATSVGTATSDGSGAATTATTG